MAWMQSSNDSCSVYTGKGLTQLLIWGSGCSCLLLVSSPKDLQSMLRPSNKRNPDVIGEITFSKSFGFLENGTDGGAFRQIENALRSASWVGQVPWIYWLHDYMTPIIGSRLGIAARHGTIRQIAAREIMARREGKYVEEAKEEQDILSKLFNVQKKKGNQLSDDDVLSMATSNVFAGSDTTAISIRSIIYHLLRTPACLKKLRDEIEDRKRQGRFSDPVTLDQANDMPYLQACMWEGLRLHPAVGMTLPRVVPKGGIVIDGCFLPEGVR